MSIVRESISFQRGLDPKEALGIGVYFIKHPSKKDWMNSPTGYYLVKSTSGNFNMVFWDREKGGFKFLSGEGDWYQNLHNKLIVKKGNFGNEFYPSNDYLLTKHQPGKTGGYISIEWALKLRNELCELDFKFAEKMDSGEL